MQVILKLMAYIYFIHITSANERFCSVGRHSEIYHDHCLDSLEPSIIKEVSILQEYLHD